jgi:hypothetical protein
VLRLETGVEHRAPWRWIPPAGLADGLAIELRLANVSPLVDPAVELTLRRQFAPLFDPIRPLLSDHGRRPVAFSTAARWLAAITRTRDNRLNQTGAQAQTGMGYLVRQPAGFPDDEQGVAVSAGEGHQADGNGWAWRLPGSS